VYKHRVEEAAQRQQQPQPLQEAGEVDQQQQQLRRLLVEGNRL
jgi:hypothetical protein